MAAKAKQLGGNMNGSFFKRLYKKLILNPKNKSILLRRGCSFRIQTAILVGDETHG